MCGLIGIAGHIGIKEEKAFKQGLIIDTLRGEHSTGALIVDRGLDSKATIVKQVGNAFELLYDRRFDEAMKGFHKVLLGHNRFATQGQVNKVNAHPYDFHPIYGAHNGTLTQRYELQDGHKFTVDSQALYNHISLFGVEEAIGKVVGAWALTWWDAEQETINLLRNNERTLYTALSEDERTLFWSSEWEMLQLILNRNDIKYDKIKIVPLDTWVSIKLGPEGEMDKAKIKKVTGKKLKPATNSYLGSSYNGRGNTLPATVPAVNQNAATTPPRDSKVTRKGVVMELGEKRTDVHLASYMPCTDAENPDAKIRLYLNRGDELVWKKGFIVKGDINTYLTAEGGYYKVTQSSVVLGTLEEQVNFDDKMGRFLPMDKKDLDSKKVIELTSKRAKFVDHKGHKLTKEEFEKEYPTCAWCSADIVAEEANELTKGGDCLCPSCKTNPDVKTYL